MAFLIIVSVEKPLAMDITGEDLLFVLQILMGLMVLILLDCRYHMDHSIIADIFGHMLLDTVKHYLMPGTVHVLIHQGVNNQISLVTMTSTVNHPHMARLQPSGTWIILFGMVKAVIQVAVAVPH